MKAHLTLVAIILALSASTSRAQYGPICGCLQAEFYVYDDALVHNGSFEYHNLFDSKFQIKRPGESNIGFWTIEGEGVVLTGLYWQASDGSASVELNYLGSGGISQLITTTPGESYRLEFDLSGEPDMGDPIKEMQVFWDGSLFKTVSFNTTGHSRNDMGWKHFTFDLPAPTSGSTQLRFVGSIPSVGNGGAAIDNVSIELSSTSVPETSSLLLAGLALIPAALVARRARKQGV